MPRKPPELHVVSRIPGRGRPKPSAKLSPAEQRAWMAIVRSAPDLFVDEAAQIVLRRVVAEVAIAERHEERLRRIAATGGEGVLEAELAISRAHRETSKSIVAMMTSLRATPRSHVELRAARSAFAQTPKGKRPWEFEEGDVIDAEAVEPGESEGEDNDSPAA